MSLQGPRVGREVGAGCGGVVESRLEEGDAALVLHHPLVRPTADAEEKQRVQPVESVIAVDCGFGRRELVERGLADVKPLCFFKCN